MKANIRFRLYSLLLCVGLLASLPVCVSATAADTSAAAEAAPEPVDLTEYADGSSVELEGKSYTVLKTPETMVSAVTADPAGNYILGADMDLSGAEYQTPIFDPEDTKRGFSGIFDGNGHSITNFTVSSGVTDCHGLLFYAVSGSVQVRNVTVGSQEAPIEAVFTGDAVQSIGGIAGKMMSIRADAVLSDLTVYADFTYEGAREETVMIGGIVGRVGPSTIERCSFYGSILVAEAAAVAGNNTMAGGIAGRHNLEGTLTIRDCRSEAEIDISARSIGASVRACAGGILGSAEYPVVISGCANTGDVTSGHRSGGIVGDFRPQSNATQAYTILGCENSGTVRVLIDRAAAETVLESATDVAGAIGAGGILGGVRSERSSAVNAQYTVSISGCANEGNVEIGYADESIAEDESLKLEDDEAGGLLTKGKCAAGGIIGRGMFGYYLIENSYSVGEIATPGKYGANASVASGIVGYLYVNSDAERLSVIRNCFAQGRLVSGTAGRSTYGLCVVSSNSATNGYLAELVNCYYQYETDGKAVSDACNMKLSEGSRDYGEKSADAFASGEVAYLLGDAFGQSIGTDPHPVLYTDQKVAFDGDAYVNTDAAHLLAKDGFAYVQKSNDLTKIRIILVGDADEEITEAQTLVIRVKDEAGVLINSFTVTGEKLMPFVSVEALGEVYYAEADAMLFGVVIMNVPAGILEKPVNVEVEFDGQSGSAEI